MFDEQNPPVAWQVKDFGGDWITRYGSTAESRCRKEAEDTGALVRPLYASPPTSVDAVAVVTRLFGSNHIRDGKVNIRDLVFSAFMGRVPEADWANDTLPTVDQQIAEWRDEILAALRAAQQSGEARS